MLRELWVSCLIGGLLSMPGMAQEEAPQVEVISEAPASQDSWLIGPVFKLDSWGIGPQPQESHDQMIGLQVFHRMEAYFGTGGSLYYGPRDSVFEFNLDARLFWPLVVIEPYAGLELNYLTRSNGGFSLSLKPGFMAQIPGSPLYVDGFGLARYDIFNALFGTQNPNQLLLGIGLSIVYRL